MMELDPRLQNITADQLQDFTVPHYPSFAPAAYHHHHPHQHPQHQQNAVYANDLGSDHTAHAHHHAHVQVQAAQAAHAAQAYAQFIPDGTNTTAAAAAVGPVHFVEASPSNASPTSRRVNGNNNGSINGTSSVTRGQPQNVGGNNGLQNTNVNAQGMASTNAPTSMRQTRHGMHQQHQQQHQHQHQHQSHQFNNNLYASPTSTISSTNQSLHQTNANANANPSITGLPSSSTSSPSHHQQTLVHPHSHTHSHSQIQVQSQPQPQPQPQSQPQALPQIQPPPPQADPSAFNHPSTFPLVPNPPDLAEWRTRFFNITEPLLLTSEEYHTYFPHVDNIYSHRSTQKYKKKPFVSHYWDCRLKGRPTGTPLSKLRKRKEAGNSQGDVDDDDEIKANDDNNTTASGGTGKEVKKRKRKTRERDLCDVKIKITEFFGRDELEAMGKLGAGDDGTGEDGMMGMNGVVGNGRINANGQLTFVLEDGNSAVVPVNTGNAHQMSINSGDESMSFGVLEPMKKFPEGHPGADGKRWYMVQRVNGSGKDNGDVSLDHKHTLEESDRIKKNSVQRWLLAQEKERKKQNQRNKTAGDSESVAGTISSRTSVYTSSPSFHASGKAHQTAKSRAAPVSTHLVFYANSFCPFAQRIWIALETKGIPYQYVEVTPSHMKNGKCTMSDLLEVCPEGVIPLLKHENWAIWESDVVMEYLEDISLGYPLLPLSNPKLRAHSRLWKDHINRRVLPYFYALLLLPAVDITQPNGEVVKPSVAEQRGLMIESLQHKITELVNASHATGPFFLGADLSLVDVAFAPWIIRLSRVLEYYREFPKPEVGTRWKAWVDAIENNDAVRRTVSEDRSYHGVYGGVGKDGMAACGAVAKRFAEASYAERVVRQEGFGLGGDVWGALPASENNVAFRS